MKSQNKLGMKTEAGAYYVDYKDIDELRRFMGANGKILPGKRSRLNLRQQRALATAVKRARYMGLLPYVSGELARPRGDRRF